MQPQFAMQQASEGTVNGTIVPQLASLRRFTLSPASRKGRQPCERREPDRDVLVLLFPEETRLSKEHDRLVKNGTDTKMVPIEYAHGFVGMVRGNPEYSNLKRVICQATGDYCHDNPRDAKFHCLEFVDREWRETTVCKFGDPLDESDVILLFAD